MTWKGLGRALVLVAALLIGFPLGVYGASTFSLTLGIIAARGN
jgi:hypothetical protein